MFCCQAKKLPKKGRVALKFRKNRPEMSKIEQKWPKNAQFSPFLGKVFIPPLTFLPLPPIPRLSATHTHARTHARPHAHTHTLYEKMG